MTNHPGCFGSPLCHAHNALPCTRCPFEAACAEEATRVAAKLRDSFGLNSVMKVRPPRRPISAATISAAKTLNVLEPDGLPKKAQQLVQTWSQRGIDLRRAVQMRANPFELAPPKFMRIIMRELLAGGFTRQGVRRALIEELGWSDASAASHVSFGIAALNHVGVVKEEEGRLVPVIG